MKHKICVLNNIAEEGLSILKQQGYAVHANLEESTAILVRSKSISATDVHNGCLAIARAGVGVNNIPVDEITHNGVVVFNTPGANANSVKELVLAALMISSRPIVQAIEWSTTLLRTRDNIKEIVEQEKKRFAGREISGKTLGVIGLGAIGVQVSNMAQSLGMRVLGYDPFITVDAAWGLSSAVEKSDTLQHLFKNSDFVTIHVPLNEQTTGMIDYGILKYAKKHLSLLNFARGELVEVTDVLRAIQHGTIDRYVADFPEQALLGNKQVLLFPHLGASTAEAELNCAKMATKQLVAYLQYGNITNSVNFPTCSAPQEAPHRLTVINKNIPNIVGQITAILAQEKINIQDFTNRHRGDIAYNIIDTDSHISEAAIQHITQIDGVVKVRAIVTQH